MMAHVKSYGNHAADKLCHTEHFKALFRSKALQVQDFTGEGWYVVGGNYAGEPHVNRIFSSSYSGVLVPGGFGVRGTEGKIQAISWARKQKKPFLGEKHVSSIRRRTLNNSLTGLQQEVY